MIRVSSPTPCLSATPVRALVAPGLLVMVALSGDRLGAKDLPVDHEALERVGERDSGRSGVANFFSIEQIYDAVRDGDSGGLKVDFSHVSHLLDGSELPLEKLYGTVYAGPYPFESRETRYAYKRFRLVSGIGGGKGSLEVSSLLNPRLNSERWTDRGQLAVRFDLAIERDGRDRKLGTYDTLVGFEKKKDKFVKTASLLEGPFVNLVRSDVPDEATISFLTREEIRAEVVVTPPDGEPRIFWDDRPRLRHEIRLRGLEPATVYSYRVVAGAAETRSYELATAPARDSKAAVRFGYFGDTRAGSGGGLLSYMGVNYNTLSRIAQAAYRQGASFLIVGGDLVNGYTTVRADFEAQLHAWKQAVTGFWNERPIYTAMGNHEALLRYFRNGVRIDRWPYETESAEAVFGKVFVHPENGPRPSDRRRPQYRENVYSFDYGFVRCIAFNNNYWVSYAADRYGGCPEGYMLKDQMDWILGELERAEKDPFVRYILLFAQEPIFPNGGHLGDSMWHGGDNRVRAHIYDKEKKRIFPEEDGVLVVRNRFVRAIAASRKVAAVLGSDEHAYHRVLIGRDVPVGDIDRDDRNKTGKIDVDIGEDCSPLGDLKFNTWYLVGGGGGAPYYAEEDTPWNEYWATRTTPRSDTTGYYYSSQENYMLFEATAAGISMKAYNLQGEIIDAVADLMADKE